MTNTHAHSLVTHSTTGTKKLCLSELFSIAYHIIVLSYVLCTYYNIQSHLYEGIVGEPKRVCYF